MAGEARLYLLAFVPVLKVVIDLDRIIGLILAAADELLSQIRSKHVIFSSD
jgi:hypothetical protein